MRKIEPETESDDMNEPTEDARNGAGRTARTPGPRTTTATRTLQNGHVLIHGTPYAGKTSATERLLGTTRADLRVPSIDDTPEIAIAGTDDAAG